MGLLLLLVVVVLAVLAGMLVERTVGGRSTAGGGGGGGCGCGCGLLAGVFPGRGTPGSLSPGGISSGGIIGSVVARTSSSSSAMVDHATLFQNSGRFLSFPFVVDVSRFTSTYTTWGYALNRKFIATGTSIPLSTNVVRIRCRKHVPAQHHHQHQS